MDVKDLRARAIGATLFRLTTLRAAVGRLGFVQADPIRSPARAQDLVLRQRVTGYRAGDLERRYEALGLDEDFLYAHGFMTRGVWEDLHPRWAGKPTAAERRVLEIVARHGRLHPKELEAYFGRARQVNAWGGYSKATTRTLHALHHRGLLRVAGRDQGIRVYEPARPSHPPAEPAERLRRLVLRIAGLLAPAPERSLRAALQLFRRGAPLLPGRLAVVSKLLKDGDLEGETVDGLHYVWPAGRAPRGAPAEVVRFLAPFDPVVWDRRRFEHLWGWAYRFEAYTPAHRRKMGYYALPLLWRDQVIGWVNASNVKGDFRIEAGFVRGKPDDRAFRVAFEAEVQSLRGFLAAR